MKNKNRIFRAAALLLVLCFISTVMISGTFAKYTSEFSGEDTALVAKWDVVVAGGQEDDENLKVLTKDGSTAKALDLFSHAFTDGIVTDPGKIIAPGVDGSFVLSVTNNSDVAAGVTFKFEKATGSVDVPMEYRLAPFDSEEGGNIYTDLNDLEEALKNTTDLGFVNIKETSGEAQAPVYWRWPFEKGTGEDLIGNDATDTGLGVASAGGEGSRTEYILTVTATATQLPPDKGNDGGSTSP